MIDGKYIFHGVGKMGECLAGISITADTLQAPQDCGHGRKETHQMGMRGIASPRGVPRAGIKTEK